MAERVSHPFAQAIVADDHDAAIATLAEDVEFRSPAVHKPYHGKAQVGGILRLVATVFENFRYTAEWRDGPLADGIDRRLHQGAAHRDGGLGARRRELD